MADGEGTTTTTTTPAVEAGKTFTQSDLDRLIGERLTRERDTNKTQLAEFDVFKGKASKLDAMEAANQTEAEKVATAIKDRDTRIEAADKRALDAEARATGLTRQAKAATVATSLMAYDPNDSNIAQAVAAIDPAGENADAEILAALTALKTAKAYLFRPAGSRVEPFNPGGANGVALTDAQRVANVLNPRGGRDYGPLGR